MSSSSKLFVLSLVGLFHGGSAQCSSGCITDLTAAQTCLRECVNKNPVEEWGGAVNFETNGASRLWQCLPGNGKLPQFTNPDPLIDLMGCCEMTAACNQTMLAARSCSQNSCIPSCIKPTAGNYTQCIVEKSQERVCNFAGLCVGQLTGNDAFDFAKALGQSANQVTSTDCSPMNDFVDGVCDISNRCCSDCNIKMSALTSCLVNDFLLPLSTSGGTVTCQISTPADSTCAITGAQAVAVARATDDAPNDNNGDAMEDFFDEGADISDCEESLTFDYIIHNETFAVDQFMSCLGKKVGQIIAQSENDTSPTNEEDSAASHFYGAAALLVSAFLAVLTL